MSGRLRRAQRLATAEVARALKDGRLTRAQRFHLYTRPNTLAVARIALVVPKKLAPRAVDRNRIRRIAREAFRLGQAQLAGLDCIFRLVKPCRMNTVTLAELKALLEAPRDVRPRD